MKFFFATKQKFLKVHDTIPIDDFKFAEHPKGEHSFYDKESKKRIKLDGYYRQVNKLTKKEIEEAFTAQKNYTSKLEAEIRSLKRKLKEQEI